MRAFLVNEMWFAQQTFLLETASYKINCGVLILKFFHIKVNIFQMWQSNWCAFLIRIAEFVFYFAFPFNESFMGEFCWHFYWSPIYTNHFLDEFLVKSTRLISPLCALLSCSQSDLSHLMKDLHGMILTLLRLKEIPKQLRFIVSAVGEAIRVINSYDGCGQKVFFFSPMITLPVKNVTWSNEAFVLARIVWPVDRWPMKVSDIARFHGWKTQLLHSFYRDAVGLSGPEFAGGGRTTEIFFRCIVHAKHKRLDRSELKVTQYRNPSWRYLKKFLILCRRKNNVKTESSFTFKFCWTYIGETFFAFKSSPTKERKEMDKLSPSVSLSFDRQLCKRNLSNTVGKVRWRIYACELSSSFPLSQNQFL